MTATAKVYDFPLSIRWLSGRRTVASVHGKDDLEIATPPEFNGGVDGVWSPEDLLVASIGSCFTVTLLAVAERRGIPAARTGGRRQRSRHSAQQRPIRLHRGGRPRGRRNGRRVRERGAGRGRDRRARLPGGELGRLPGPCRARRPQPEVDCSVRVTAVHPSASFSATLRVRLENRPGTFARLAEAIGEAGGLLGAIDLVRAERGTKVRDVTVLAATQGRWSASPTAVHELDGNRGDQRLRPHLPDASRRQDRDRAEDAAEDPRRPLDGLHARRRARLVGDRRRSGEGLEPDDQAEHGRRGQRRHGGARARRHRPRGRAAGDGGQGDAVQGVRRRRRLPDLPRDEGHRRDRCCGEGDRAGVRRDQPRGHLGAALLRDRGSAARRARHPRLPRRPARDGDRHARRAAQRAPGRRQAARGRCASSSPASAPPASR